MILNILSQLNELDTECQRLRRQNRHLRHETQRHKKIVDTYDQELEGVWMENQGLKYEVEWLRGQMLLLSNNDEKVARTYKEKVTYASDTINSNIASTTSTHSESYLAFSSKEEDILPISKKSFRAPLSPSYSNTISWMKRAKHNNLSRKKSSSSHHDNDDTQCVSSKSTQDENPSSLLNRCNDERKEPLFFSLSKVASIKAIHPTKSVEIPGISQGKDASSLLSNLCLGKFIGDKDKEIELEIPHGCPRYPEAKATGLELTSSRPFPISLSGRSRTILLPKRLSLS